MKPAINLAARFIASFILTFALLPPAGAVLIDFNDPFSLARLFQAGRSTLVNNYAEDGMTFAEGVVPPDPRLSGQSHGFYGLNYEDPAAYTVPPGACNPPITPLSACDPPFFNPNFPAQNFARSLGTHLPRQVIQMTYDPNNDGVRDEFNLVSLDVLTGSLNVGVQFASSRIGVANNLTAGFRYLIIGAGGINRVTFEGIGDLFTIDNIEFMPISRLGALEPLQQTIERVSIPLTVAPDFPSFIFTREFDELLHRKFDIPEPSTVALFSTGFLGLLVFGKSYRKVTDG